MNRFFILLFFVVCAFTSFGQRSYKPSKIGETKEFIGKIDMASQFDYDATFSINDSKLGMGVLFYLANGCCCLGEDKYALPINISDELYTKIFSEDEWKKLKIKVTAKASYGILCSSQDNVPPVKKVIIWRPIAVVIAD
jgi:hypothetical protein